MPRNVLPDPEKNTPEEEREAAAARIARAADDYNRAVLDAIVNHGLDVDVDFVYVDRTGKRLKDDEEGEGIEAISVKVSHTTEYM